MNSSELQAFLERFTEKIPFYKMRRKAASTKVNISKYTPHQGVREKARRLRQAERRAQ